jgi:hypothetical protein
MKRTLLALLLAVLAGSAFAGNTTDSKHNYSPYGDQDSFSASPAQ